jgi:hypothetical protein
VPSLEKLVRFAFKVSAGLPSVPQKQWESALLAAGADLATARRILFFSPHAAARVRLRDKNVRFLSDDYVIYVPAEGSKSMVHLPLAAEPVFQACLLTAERCSPTELERLFARSATANAVRALGKDEGLQVGAMMIDREWLCPSDDAVAKEAPRAKLSWRHRLQLLFS